MDNPRIKEVDAGWNYYDYSRLRKLGITEYIKYKGLMPDSFLNKAEILTFLIDTCSLRGSIEKKCLPEKCLAEKCFHDYYILNNDKDYDGDGKIEGCEEDLEGYYKPNCVIHNIEEKYYINPSYQDYIKKYSTGSIDNYCESLILPVGISKSTGQKLNETQCYFDDNDCDSIDNRKALFSKVEGCNSILYPIVNEKGKSNGSNNYLCEGKWTVNTLGDNFTSTCDTGWIKSARTKDTTGTKRNDYNCGEWHKINVKNEKAEGCVTEVISIENGDGKKTEYSYKCYGYWTIDAKGSNFESTCKGDYGYDGWVKQVNNNTKGAEVINEEAEGYNSIISLVKNKNGIVKFKDGRKWDVPYRCNGVWKINVVGDKSYLACLNSVDGWGESGWEKVD